jgi:hypothetical protein
MPRFYPMKKTLHIADRVQSVLDQRNRELVSDAILKIALGITLTLPVFGILFGAVYWLGWFVGVWIALDRRGSGAMSDSELLFIAILAAFVTGVVFTLAVWSAWRRVCPLAVNQPFTNRQIIRTIINKASNGPFDLRPHHATSAGAFVFIGGPSSFFEGVGSWFQQLRADRALIEDAAKLLGACKETVSVKQVTPAAALLLKRLALIKVVLSVDSPALALTQRGFDIVDGGKKS